MINEKAIEDNTQKAIDALKQPEYEGLSTEKKMDAIKKQFPSVPEMEKDFKESQQADLEENFEEGL